MSGRWLRWVLSLVHRPPAAGESRLTIVRHHRIYENGEDAIYRLGVGQRVLERQLELFAGLGMPPLTVSEGLDRLEEGAPGHWIALTFDDGYADNVERALPLMLRHGARGTFFLTAGLMERREAPWWDVLAHALTCTAKAHIDWEVSGRARRLALGDFTSRRRALRALLPSFRLVPERRAERLADLRDKLGVHAPVPCALASWQDARRLVEAGMEVGAHTMTHPCLSLLDAAGQQREIADSVTLIGRRLDVVPNGFAYPEGDFDGRSIEAVRAANLKWAVTTRSGENRRGGSVFELRRRGLSEGACLGPRGRFSDRLARAELEGAFDGLRGVEAAS